MDREKLVKKFIGKKINGSLALVLSLLWEKVEVVFGYPGGAIMPFYDVLFDYQDKIHHVLVRHEQGAAHAAEGYARSTGKPGICFVTSGPGATNLVTGLADAMMDSVPIICFTGQVASAVIGTDAFQETDIIGITSPITKWNYQITSAKEIPDMVTKAFYLATHGRPGPVVIDLTKNAQMEEFTFYLPQKIEILGFDPVIYPNPKQINFAASLINQAKRPLILAGHGVIIAKATDLLQKFAEKTGIPVAFTLHGLSSLPTDHPLSVGFLGMHGNYAPNILTNKADVIIALGMRFDDRVTGKLSAYAPQAKIIHIDIDPAELNKNVKTEVPIVADVGFALKALLSLVKKKNYPSWLEQFRRLFQIEKKRVIDKQLALDSEKIRMAQVINLLSHKIKKMNKKTAIVTDVGQHQMITARYFSFSKGDQFISSGGLGTMGFGLPAAIGAKLGCLQKEVIAILGDGGFQMTIQELGTIMQEKLPVKIIVLNNNYLGMVRQWQELFFNRRYSFTHLTNPDFINLVKSYHIKSKRVEKYSELDQSLEQLILAKEPYFLEIVVEKEDKVFPMVPAGAGLEEIILE